MLGFVVGGPRSRVMNWSLDKTFIFQDEAGITDEKVKAAVELIA